MKILHVTRDYPPRHTGGLSTAVGGSVRALRACGLSCHVVSFDEWRPNSDQTGTTAPCAPGVTRVSGPNDLTAAREAAEAFGADVVHVHDAFLWEFARALARKTVATLHVLQRHQNVLRGLTETKSSQCEKVMVAECQRLLVPSKNAQSLVQEPSHVVPLGIDAAQWPTGSEPRTRSVLYVGRFSDLNGTDAFSELAATLSQDDIDIRIAGGLPANERGQAKWLERFPNHCRVLGWLDQQALGREYQRAGVVVVPSRFETFGQVTLEAAWCGAPVMATRTGAHEDILGPDAPYIENVDNVGAWCCHVKTVLASPPPVRRDTLNAYTWDALGKQLIRHYEAL